MSSEILSDKPVLVLTGPTGSGKSGRLYNLARDLPLEIINADSRQVYRYMSIGTALPSDDELNRWPHHLFSFLAPSEQFSAGRFREACRKHIDEIHIRGRLPVIIGGTWFYIKALWDGLAEEPEISDELKAEINSLDHRQIRELLEQKDPVSFERIAAADINRNRRALLFSLAAGRPFSENRPSGGLYENYNFQAYRFSMPRDVLYERINRRTVEMFRHGLIAETRSLLEKGYSSTDAGLNTIGYREVLEYAARHPALYDETGGEHKPPTELVEKVAMNTRHYAKRQLSFFRHERRVKTIDHDRTNEHLSGIVGRLARQ